jgi:hypothetical protein
MWWVRTPMLQRRLVLTFTQAKQRSLSNYNFLTILFFSI